MSFSSSFIIVDKPGGVTSFAMVALIRRLTGVRRVGHAGTLDPLATGVLPVAIGQATRLIEYLDDTTKTYLARVRFGITTDTYDAEGKVTSTADARGIREAELRRVLRSFVGTIEQTPPAYSAIKVAGRPLYRYAREGTAVAVAPRRVEIKKIQLRAYEHGFADLEVECGKGTYIRSLAHDLGQVLGCGAHLESLRRTSSGGFDVAGAWGPDQLTDMAAAGELEAAALAPDRAVERRPAALLGPETGRLVGQGRDVILDTLGAVPGSSICRAYAVDGRFLGVLRARDEGTWHPVKVVPEARFEADLGKFL